MAVVQSVVARTGEATARVIAAQSDARSKTPHFDKGVVGVLSVVMHFISKIHPLLDYIDAKNPSRF